MSTISKIFISYRRAESAGHAGRVHDRLQAEFGRDLLFMDVEDIPLGVNFVKFLRQEVSKCDVLLAVIGAKWLDALDEHGNRRLDDPNDFVRLEIGTALQRDIPVIPILLDGAKIPRSALLPPDLQELALRNGLEIRHAYFHSDMEKLIKGLKRLSGHSVTVPPRITIEGLDSPQNSPSSLIKTFDLTRVLLNARRVVRRKTVGPQTTLAKTLSLSGIGVHSGMPVTLTISPASDDFGYVFVSEDSSRIGVIEDNVVSTDLTTVIGRDTNARISSVSATLSALVGLGIDNATIELGGQEAPVLDGSSFPLVQAIQAAGVKKLSAPRKYIKILKPIRVQQGEAYGELFPSDGTIFESTTKFDHPLLGIQKFKIDLDPRSYVDQISRARTFGFMKDIAKLWSAGHALGASLENTIVFSDERILNADGLRYPDECVRHKILGAIGDFAFLGAPMLGHYSAYMGGHKLNHAVISKLLEDKSAFSRVSNPDT